MKVKSKQTTPDKVLHKNIYLLQKHHWKQQTNAANHSIKILINQIPPKIAIKLSNYVHSNVLHHCRQKYFKVKLTLVSLIFQTD